MKRSKFDIVEYRSIGNYNFIVPVTENEVQSLFDTLCVRGILPYERLGHWRLGSSPDCREILDILVNKKIACELEYRSRAFRYHTDSMLKSYPNGILFCWEHDDSQIDELFKQVPGWNVLELRALCNPLPEEEFWGNISLKVQDELKKNKTIQSWRRQGTYHIAHRFALLVNEFSNDDAFTIHSGEKRWVRILHKDTQKIVITMRLYPEEEGERLKRCETKRIEIFYWINEHIGHYLKGSVDKRENWPNPNGSYSQYVMSTPNFLDVMKNFKRIFNNVKQQPECLTDMKKHSVIL